MRTLLVLPPQLLPVSWRINAVKIWNQPPNRTHLPSPPIRFFYAKMASQSTSHSLTQIISLPRQLEQPVTIESDTGVSEVDFRNAIECSLFRQWLKNIQMDSGLLANGIMCLRRVLIQNVDMFGSRVGFLKFKADVIDKETGCKVPGIVFARGPAVTVLILLDSDGETYAVLTEQVRVPVGKHIMELPAGMLDDDKGDIAGTAIRECFYLVKLLGLNASNDAMHIGSQRKQPLCIITRVEEETGLQLNLDDLVDLTAFLDPSTGCRVYPSPGGCDEDIGVFLYRGKIDKEIIKQLQGKETGLQDHGEFIRVHVVPYRNLWRMTADAKVLMAITLYEMALREGLLPASKD